MSNLLIVKPSIEYQDLYLDMCYDYINHDDPEYSYKTLEEVQKKIQSDHDYETGNIPENRLKAYSFWFIFNKKIVGTSRLRTQLKKRFELVGGHIGYDVRPSNRKMGLGTKILGLTLVEAKKIGLTEVLITCDDSNMGSYRVIENNNGIFINVVHDEIDKEKVRRYRIEL